MSSAAADTSTSANNSRKPKTKRQGSSETIKPSKSPKSSRQKQDSAEGPSNAADDVFSSDVTRSSSPLSTTSPSSPPTPKAKSSRNHRRKHKRSNAVTEAGTGHGRKLSTNYAAEESRQSLLRVEHVRQPVTSVTPVNVQATLSGSNPAPGDNVDEESKENMHPSAEASKGKGREEPPDSPRAPLRAINTNPETEMDEFCDADDPDEIPPFSLCAQSQPSSSAGVRDAHIENAATQIISPSPFSTSGPQNFRADLASSMNYYGYLPMSWGNPVVAPTPQYSNHCLTRTGATVPRVTLRIQPREEHATFWDAECGKKLVIKGRLELYDLLRETYYHQATIFVRSYVASDIRGLEHPEEPQFVMQYVEPRGSNDPNGMNRAEEIPAWAEFALNDDPHVQDKKAQITTSEWAELVDERFPLWAKYFSIPIPARLFETRESRLFQIEAKVSYFSRIEGGQMKELQAPTAQVSVSHLLSARELGIWNRESCAASPW